MASHLCRAWEGALKWLRTSGWFSGMPLSKCESCALCRRPKKSISLDSSLSYLQARSCVWSQELCCPAVLFSLFSWVDHKVDLQWYLFPIAWFQGMFDDVSFFPCISTCGAAKIYNACNTPSARAAEKVRSNRSILWEARMQAVSERISLVRTDVIALKAN